MRPCSFSEPLAAEDSSTKEAFCCVVVSIWPIVMLIWVIPSLCSWLARAISSTNVWTLETVSTISCIPLSACETSPRPSAILLTEALIMSRISLAEAELLWASVLTSPATTANPRPCSPALAASTAAFSARILVWKAIPSITAIISPIFSAPL
ncbi:hypothetical protein D3C72_1908740 [compost metagenome]